MSYISINHHCKGHIMWDIQLSLAFIVTTITKKDVTNFLPRQHIKKQRHYFANKDLSSQGYGFSSMDVRVGL